MSQISVSTSRLYFGAYFTALTLTTITLSVLAALNSISSVATAALAALAIFAVLGTGLLIILTRKLTGPMNSVTTFTNHILEGNYAKADADALLPAAELGKAVGELASLYKERLGFSTSMLNGLPIPCCIVDTKERITFLNKECLLMLGSHESPESYYGKMISQIFYKDDRKSLIGTCMDNNERAMNRDAIFKHVDGSDINILANLFPLSDVDKTVIGGCCLYLDTTELKRNEAEILDQNERIAKAAQEANVISEEMAAAAVQLSGVVSNAKTGTCAQSERTTETASAMEEMNATVLEVARHAHEAAEDANDARTRAENGATIVTEVISSINDVAEHAGELKGSMEQLDERAENIGKVLGVIEDIADQTNLLALNAAIEAARAGEAGRGFAVVADEVRKLAEKTMQATNEVHSAIMGIQEGARKNVKATETAVASVEKSTEMAGRSGEALSAIVSVAESTADRVRAIATAAEQQSAASEQINAATLDVSRVCGETDLLMLDAAEAIDRLAQLADSLTSVIREME